ncbi:MAG: lipid-binding protein [Rikenellaceae bacterium]
MKRFIQIFLMSCLAFAGLSSCETYDDDYDQDFSPVFPLCGEWRVDIFNAATNAKVTRATIYTYDTADKSNSQMWLWVNNATYGTKCKISCDPAAAAFSGTNVANVLYTGTTNTVTNGVVVVNGSTTPSGGKSDSIEFTYYSSKANTTYNIKGYRRTGWPEDE